MKFCRPFGIELFYGNGYGEMSIVILEIYYFPNGLIFIIHNKVPPNFQGSWGKKIEKIIRFQQRQSKLKKGYMYSQDLVKQTIVVLHIRGC